MTIVVKSFEVFRTFGREVAPKDNNIKGKRKLSFLSFIKEFRIPFLNTSYKNIPKARLRYIY